jgi:hypothetical protein
MSTPTGISSATTYQAVVIALVAAGIISIGVMSVCYRRRRRDEWERTVRAGLERARFRHGFGDGFGPGEGDGIGEKPVLWDVDIGGGDDWVVSNSLHVLDRCSVFERKEAIEESSFAEMSN